MTFKVVATPGESVDEVTIYYTLGDNVGIANPFNDLQKNQIKVYAEKKVRKSAAVITDFLK